MGECAKLAQQVERWVLIILHGFFFLFHDIHVCNEMGEKEQSVENKMNERIGQDKREREREIATKW